MLHSLVNGTVVGGFFVGSGASSTVANLSEAAFALLALADPGLHGEMRDRGICLALVACSWLTVLFAQSYGLVEILPLWDFLLADAQTMRHKLSCLVAAHLVGLRQRLLGKTFPQMMEQFKDLEFRSQREVVVLCKRIQDGKTLKKVKAPSSCFEWCK
jgi:hypothetical protein